MYFTGTDSTGTVTTQTCSNWTQSENASASGGNPETTTLRWTQNINLDCSKSSHLLCIQVDSGDPLPNFAEEGRKAFVTSEKHGGNLGNWPIVSESGLTGISAGNKICQELASAANLERSEKFVALLADDSNDAEDIRIAAPIVRLDGVKVADSKSNLFDDSLLTTISVNEKLEYVSDPVWTGIREAEKNCLNWKDSIIDNGTIGNSSIRVADDPADLGGHWLSWTTLSCSSDAALYCFEGL